MKLPLLCSATFLPFALAISATAEPAWTDLVGTSLDTHWTTTGNWALKDGVATLTPREGETGWSRFGAYLWSKRTYTEFEIEFDYLLAEKGNSGFYFRVADPADPVKQGIEVQIYDSASWPADKPLNDHDSGGIIPRIPPTKRSAKPAGEWNHFHITCRANQLTVILNGEVVNVVDLTQDPLASRPATGYLGFQDHGLPLSLRNIRVRELP